MAFEAFNENIPAHIIFEGFAKQLASEKDLEFVTLSEDSDFLEFEILGIPEDLEEPSFRIARTETEWFMEELTEKLEKAYPQYQWRDYVSLAGRVDEPASIYIDYNLLLGSNTN